MKKIDFLISIVVLVYYVIISKRYRLNLEK